MAFRHFLALAVLAVSAPAFGLCGEILGYLAAHEAGVRLTRTNSWSRDLNRPSATKAADLYKKRFLIDDRTPVCAMKQGVPDPTQPTGFRRVLTPMSLTGFFVPEAVDFYRPETLAGYDGVLIVLPGIGTNRSDATTLFTLGQTFNSGNDSSLKVDGREKKIRLLPILLDATLGGMASEAPLYFGEHNYAMAVIRHLRLMMKQLAPGLPCFLAGRSQGGLMAMEYAEWFADVAGVMAVNPSPTRPDLHQAAQDLGTASLATVMDSPVRLNRTFESYTFHTANYVSFGTHNAVDRVHRWMIRSAQGFRNTPTLLLIGRRDEGYPPEYQRYVQQFVDALRAWRAVQYFDGPHDLWTRRDRNLYRQVVHQMASFVASKL